jgi:hypothetical protein
MVIVDTLIHPLQVLLSFQGGPTDAAQFQGLWEFLGGTSSSGTTVPQLYWVLDSARGNRLVALCHVWATKIKLVYMCDICIYLSFGYL